MLRLVVLILILANGLYFAWSHRIFSELSWGKTQQTEPHRLQQQINPERIRVLEINDVRGQNTPTSVSTSVTATSATLLSTATTSECFLTGTYNDEQIDHLQVKLAALMPPNSWFRDEVSAQQNWLIYMGKYTNSRIFELKKAELKKMQLAFTALTDGPLSLGISLGRFPSQTSANQSLYLLTQRGIRTAKVVPAPNVRKNYQLVFPAISSDAVLKINAMTAPLSGKPLHPC
jgi:hypothetical protein